jgi:hypothetical protein
VVCGGGDVDGDKLNDFVISAPEAQSDSDSMVKAGRAYVIYGMSSTAQLANIAD